MRLPMGDKIGHAEILIGDSHVMLSDEWPDMASSGPSRGGGATAA
jgi:PhnB protein